MKAEYTQGNIVKTLLLTAIAMLASTLAMSGYNMADTFFVGQLRSAEPLAAMGFTFPVVMLLGCIFHGFGGGCMTTMAQALGRNDMEQASRIVTAGVHSMLVLSLFLAGVGILISDMVFGLLGASGHTLELVNKYMNIWFIGCATGSISMMGNSLLIAAGKPRISSCMTIVGMVINVVLDPFMIFGGECCISFIKLHCAEGLHGTVSFLFWIFRGMPAMGISGAALATVISQFVSALFMVMILHRLRLLHLRPLPIKQFASILHLIITYALPATLGMLLFPIATSITTWTTGHFGIVAVAGVAAAGRLEMVAFVLPMSFGIPLMPFIAQNYGAKLYSRVRFSFKFAVGFAFVVLNIAAVILFIWGKDIVPFFTPEPEVQAVMVRFMRIVPWGFALIEITRFAGFALVGCGHPVKDTILKCVRICCIMIPMYLATWYWHWYDGIFYSRLVTDVVGGIFCLAFAWHTVHRLPLNDGESDS